jgi:L-ascorbate metabolism protein UlaG (beta-lactamase superfamily)
MTITFARIGAIAMAVCCLVAAPALAVEIQWFGQSALKISTPGGKVILVDPFISNNPKTPEEHKDLSKIGKVDLILLTHGHGDHVGDTIELAGMTGAKVAMNSDMGQTFRLLGLLSKEQLIRFNKGGPIQPVEGITVTMVGADHSSEDIHDGAVHPGGEPIGFIIELEDGKTIYHAGDTGVFADMAFIGSFYDPDVAFLPIGGHFTIDPTHAAYAIENLLGPRTIVPVHYGTFPLLKGTPEELIEALGETEAKVVVMEPGETRTF